MVGAAGEGGSGAGGAGTAGGAGQAGAAGSGATGGGAGAGGSTGASGSGGMAGAAGSSGAGGMISCPPGTADCDADPASRCETPLNTLENCGGCKIVCELAHAGESCEAGSCMFTGCEAGFHDCDMDASNGCETDIHTASDCGGCGTLCALAHASAACDAGVCELAACDPGWGDCDGELANGCETELNRLASCGGCGAACDYPNASETCDTGVCRLGACDAKWGDCDNDPTSGCETPLTTLENCGACGVVCDIPGAGESCATGTCEPSSCQAGLGDCDGNTGNGCETSLATLQNCGGCGLACDLANAGESCPDGTCSFEACDPGFGDCDGNTGNGCETSLATLQNCGACAVACGFPNAGASCDSGSCSFAGCNADFGDCDGNTGNGCETSLTTTSDCGSCGVGCAFPNASATCSGGSCSFGACVGGFADCDGSSTNGCEIELTSDDANCGGCGVACIGQQACVGGSCVCQPDCRGGAECGNDGCSGSCGSCGALETCNSMHRCVCQYQTCGSTCCGVGESCVAGRCQPPALDVLDLTVSLSRNFNGPAIAGVPVIYTATIRNSGTVPVPATKARIRLTGEAMGREYSVPALSPGQTHDAARMHTWTMFGQLVAVNATADSGNAVMETNESNNSDVLGHAIDPQTDLLAESFFSFPPPPFAPGTRVTFVARFRNAGSGRSGPHMSAIRVGSEADPPLDAVPILNPGQVHQVLREWIAGSDSGGGGSGGPGMGAGGSGPAPEARAIADYPNEVDETRENNNTRTMSF